MENMCRPCAAKNDGSILSQCFQYFPMNTIRQNNINKGMQRHAKFVIYWGLKSSCSDKTVVESWCCLRDSIPDPQLHILPANSCRFKRVSSNTLNKALLIGLEVWWAKVLSQWIWSTLIMFIFYWGLQSFCSDKIVVESLYCLRDLIPDPQFHMVPANSCRLKRVSPKHIKQHYW